MGLTHEYESRRPDPCSDIVIQSRPVQDILDRVRAAITEPAVSVGSVVRAMDASAQMIFLLLPALILITPLSGIPGMSSLGGLTIALVALQILLGRSAIWLPGFVLRRQIPAERLGRALDRLARPAAFIDRKMAARAAWVVAFPFRQIALALCMLCGMSMPFLELVPFSATILALVVSILASALLVRDGLMLAFGLGGFGLAILVVARLATS